jgi:hypothetical protein
MHSHDVNLHMGIVGVSNIHANYPTKSRDPTMNFGIEMLLTSSCGAASLNMGMRMQPHRLGELRTFLGSLQCLQTGSAAQSLQPAYNWS